MSCVSGTISTQVPTSLWQYLLYSFNLGQFKLLTFWTLQEYTGYTFLFIAPDAYIFNIILLYLFFLDILLNFYRVIFFCQKLLCYYFDPYIVWILFHISFLLEPSAFYSCCFLPLAGLLICTLVCCLLPLNTSFIISNNTFSPLFSSDSGETYCILKQVCSFTNEPLLIAPSRSLSIVGPRWLTFSNHSCSQLVHHQLFITHLPCIRQGVYILCV